jgi:hypothetical protein
MLLQSYSNISRVLSIHKDPKSFVATTTILVSKVMA